MVWASPWKQGVQCWRYSAGREFPLCVAKRSQEGCVSHWLILLYSVCVLRRSRLAIVPQVSRTRVPYAPVEHTDLTVTARSHRLDVNRLGLLVNGTAPLLRSTPLVTGLPEVDAVTRTADPVVTVSVAPSPVAALQAPGRRKVKWPIRREDDWSAPPPLQVLPTRLSLAHRLQESRARSHTK